MSTGKVLLIIFACVSGCFLLLCGGCLTLALLAPSIESAKEAREIKASKNRPAPVEKEVTPVDFTVLGQTVGEKVIEKLKNHIIIKSNDGNGNFTVSDRVTIGDGDVFFILYFIDHNLEGMQALFDSDDFIHLVDAYKEKFGVPPHETYTARVKTKYGTTDSLMVSWKTTSGDFTIQQYSNIRGRGGAFLYTLKYKVTKQLEEDEKKKELIENL